MCQTITAIEFSGCLREIRFVHLCDSGLAERLVTAEFSGY
jgi:hypothetical protein